jgi:hypothetical protein
LVKAREAHFLKLETEAKLKLEAQAKKDNEFSSRICFG